jgi:hypothetical protein
MNYESTASFNLGKYSAHSINITSKYYTRETDKIIKENLNAINDRLNPKLRKTDELLL